MNKYTKLDYCPICVKSFDSPYRRRNKTGQITEGCIHPCHDEYLIKTSSSWEWVVSCRKHNKEIQKSKKSI